MGVQSSNFANPLPTSPGMPGEEKSSFATSGRYTCSNTVEGDCATMLMISYTIKTMLQSTSGTAQIASEPAPQGATRRAIRSLGRLAPAARRFLVIAAIAFWLGGFTFYSGVAIPMGVEVLGTHRAVGFITERVTNWLNVAGVCALAIFAWNMVLGWRASGKALRYTLLITWLVMVAIEIELVSLHPVMDRLLTTQPVREILDEDKFDLLHHVYLISTSVQWFFGMIHVWCVCVMWKQPASRAAATNPVGTI